MVVWCLFFGASNFPPKMMALAQKLAAFNEFLQKYYVESRKPKRCLDHYSTVTALPSMQASFE
jgi:hypothetical protein